VDNGKIRIVCVDDHAVVREGLALIINLQHDMEVVGSAATGEEAVDLVAKLNPDVTLMDLEMPRMNGVAATSAITANRPSARIVILTVHQGNEDIFRALQAGAVTYVLKDTLTKDLIRVIRQVHGGERPLPAEIAAGLADRARGPVLTGREVEVLELMALGLANREIALALAISDQTVHAHAKNIFAKLEVGDRIAAVTAALRRGIIHLRPSG
jgi:DNA-binding NarL/FixJ family response regulator